jgi:hypothetical protein
MYLERTRGTLSHSPLMSAKAKMIRFTNAHSYHTKVPHKAIMRYLLHYTQPGDIVLDSFCGTGMMGVAAQLCGDRRAVESMGYRVDAEGDIFERIDDGTKSEWRCVSKIGARRPVLNDLSAIGGFIAYNFNASTDVHALQRDTEKLTKFLESNHGWMYQTLHQPTPEQLIRGVKLITEQERPNLSEAGHSARINYTVWSDVFFLSRVRSRVSFF